MIKRNSILKNSFFLMVGKIGNYVLTFFNTVLITRHLGPEIYGEYTLVLSILAMLVVLWNFGLGALLTRDVSREPEKAGHYVNGVMTIVTFIALVTTIILQVVMKQQGYDNHIITSVIIFALASYFTSITGIYEAVFSAFRRMEFNSALSLARPVFLFAALLIAVRMAPDVKIIFLCQFSASFLIFMMALFFVRKFTKPFFLLDFGFLLSLMKRGFTFLLISVVHIVLYRIDHLMLSSMKNNEALGYYGSATTLIDLVLTFFPVLIVSSAYPVLADLYRNDRQEMLKIFHVLYKYLLIIGIPASLGIFLLGDEIITVVYGVEFLQAGLLLSILGCIISFSFLSLLMAWTLTAMDRQKTVLLLNFVLMIINIITNIYAIKKFGAIGAASTTCFCSVCSFIYFSVILIREEMFFIRFNEFFKVMCCSSLMVILILYLKENSFITNNLIKLVIIIALSILIYGGSALLCRLIKKKEVQILLQ